jgi:hypothetical protein
MMQVIKTVPTNHTLKEKDDVESQASEVSTQAATKLFNDPSAIMSAASLKLGKTFRENTQRGIVSGSGLLTTI